MKKLNRAELIKELKENLTIEQLEEIGKINLDAISNNIDLTLLIEVLEEEFEIEADIENGYLVNENYEA